MKWLGKLLGWAWKGVKAVVETVFRWAYENPTIGYVVGGSILIYGLLSRQEAYSFMGASILLASVAGSLVGGLGDLIKTPLERYGTFMMDVGVAG